MSSSSQSKYTWNCGNKLSFGIIWRLNCFYYHFFSWSYVTSFPCSSVLSTEQYSIHIFFEICKYLSAKEKHQVLTSNILFSCIHWYESSFHNERETFWIWYTLSIWMVNFPLDENFKVTSWSHSNFFGILFLLWM